MITAVDTNILLDIFLPDPVFGQSSMKSLEAAYDQGALVICGAVYAELAPQFEERKLLDASLSKIGIEVIPINNNSSYLAGKLWAKYKKKNKSHDRIISDFLIGSFAKLQADRFLTRDRGFYRNYFDGLKII